MGERFLKMPMLILSDPTLTPAEKLVAAYIADREGLYLPRGDVFRESASRMSASLGMSERTIRRAILRLEAHGAVTIFRQNGSPSIVRTNPGQNGRATADNMDTDRGQSGRATADKVDAPPRTEWPDYRGQSGRQERLSSQTEKPDVSSNGRGTHVRPDHEGRAQRLIDAWPDAYRRVAPHANLVRPPSNFHEATTLARDLGDVVDLFPGELLPRELSRIVMCWHHKGYIPTFRHIASRIGQSFPDTPWPDPIIYQKQGKEG